MLISNDKNYVFKRLVEEGFDLLKPYQVEEDHNKDYLFFQKVTDEEDSIRENVADLCHKQWSGWMKYLFSKSIPYKPGEVQNYEDALIIPKWAVDRWKRQMELSYSELSEEEKESDRKEADKFLMLFRSSNNENIDSL
jgi:hypothetical protein